MYKLDSNHKEIVYMAEQLGILIVDNAMVKRHEPNQLDVWFGITHPETGAGIWIWIEIKTETGIIRLSQQEKIGDCKLRGLPVRVIRDVDDLMELFNEHTK